MPGHTSFFKITTKKTLLTTSKNHGLTSRNKKLKKFLGHENSTTGLPLSRFTLRTAISLHDCVKTGWVCDFLKMILVPYTKDRQSCVVVLGKSCLIEAHFASVIHTFRGQKLAFKNDMFFRADDTFSGRI